MRRGLLSLASLAALSFALLRAAPGMAACDPTGARAEAADGVLAEYGRRFPAGPDPVAAP